MKRFLIRGGLLAVRGLLVCQFESPLSSRVFTILPAVEFMAARLRPICRMQYVVDHLNQFLGDKGLLNECPSVVENQEVAICSA